MFSDVAQIQLIYSIYNLIREVTALQRSLVMMQVSARRLPVSASVLKYTFTFQLQSESIANIFHVSGYFCTVGFGVYETAYS